MSEQKQLSVSDTILEIWRTLDFTKYNIHLIAKAILFSAVYQKSNLTPETCAAEAEKILEIFHKQADAKAAERQAELAKAEAKKLAESATLTNVLNDVK